MLDPIFKQDLRVPTGNSFWKNPDHVLWEKKKWIDTYNSSAGEGEGEMTLFGGSAGISFLKFSPEEREQWPEWKALTAEERARFLDPERPDTEIFYFVSFLAANHPPITIQCVLIADPSRSLDTSRPESPYQPGWNQIHMPAYSSFSRTVSLVAILASALPIRQNNL